ncbi:hypothetical protein X474_09825 [Dethiosulfatarculus sandiegensis]|uniref:DUF2635 domain-containing protein n=1 Tax=Dethiosulfatarculus sandiegensis TaxID=1429043 RepID=A0A0D2JEZ0_9BACT|nr:hypothetical protein X474_09825 [Dethiosulfatarculus sandiegensis]
MFLKPRKGLKVPDPKTGRDLDPQGAYVTESIYWLRRLADGDVTSAKKQKPRKEK